MTEKDLITYLEADSALDTLLGVASGNSKIYPLTPPTEAVAPYVLITWGVGNPDDEYIDEDRIQITVRADTDLVATNIRDRIKILLDKGDEIQDTVMATGSTGYHIYYCKWSGGTSFFEPDTALYNYVLFFDVKFRKKD